MQFLKSTPCCRVLFREKRLPPPHEPYLLLLLLFIIILFLIVLSQTLVFWCLKHSWKLQTSKRSRCSLYLLSPVFMLFIPPDKKYARFKFNVGFAVNVLSLLSLKADCGISPTWCYVHAFQMWKSVSSQFGRQEYGNVITIPNFPQPLITANCVSQTRFLIFSMTALHATLTICSQKERKRVKHTRSCTLSHPHKECDLSWQFNLGLAGSPCLETCCFLKLSGCWALHQKDAGN